MRDNWEWGGAALAVGDRHRERDTEGGSSMETHKPSSLAGAGYNAVHSDKSVSVWHHFSGNACKGSNTGLVGHSSIFIC